MTHRQRILNTFAGKPVDRIAWQPRITFWYQGRLNDGNMPARFAGMSLNEIYQALDCSPRPYHEFNPCLRREYGAKVSVSQVRDAEREVTTWTTPVGELQQIYRIAGREHRIEKFPVSGPEQLPVLEYVLRETHFRIDMQQYLKEDQAVGDSAAPTLYLPRTTIMGLIIDWMGYEPTIYALDEQPGAMRQVMKVMEECDLEAVWAMADSPIQIINFGDNVDSRLVSPRMAEEFLLPAYERRNKILHAASKYTHSHWDGALRGLLPLLARTDLDGFEALTPAPQGDVTLEEIRAALPERMVLLDGVPMSAFHPRTPPAEFERQVRQVIELFSPRLILGVSDELSPPCDIERIARVNEILRDYEKTDAQA